MANGEFDNLPGRGKPIDLEEDSHIPFELRMTYRMLKRAGIPPEEILMQKTAAGMRARLLEDEDLTPAEKKEIKRRLLSLDLELNMRLEQFRKQYGGL